MSAGNSKPNKGLPRWFDLVSSLTASVLLIPLFVIVAVLIKMNSKGPVFFRQKRVGMEGTEFVLYKFRTMREESVGPRITKSGDARITAVGKVIRKLKIDELPQLFNVIRGDMAIVGPRPEVNEYVDLKSPLWRAALSVKPGITDPVTLKLRNEEELLATAPDPKRFYVDSLSPYKVEGYAEYVKSRSASKDFKLIIMTLISVVFPGRTPVPTIEDIGKGWKNG